MRAPIDKHRDMARSILPSRSRAAASELARVKRASRRRVAQQLRALAHLGSDEWDDFAERFDVRAYPNRDIRAIVHWRRAADKLNHFERWAIETTKHLPVEDRLGALAAVLPRGLIGDHALSHLEWRPELNPDRPNYGAEWAASQERRRVFDGEHWARLRVLVLDMLEARDGHKELNAAMKGAAVGTPPRYRVLAGYHDVDTFLADVRGQPAWVAALEKVATTRGVTRAPGRRPGP